MKKIFILPILLLSSVACNSSEEQRAKVSLDSNAIKLQQEDAGIVTNIYSNVSLKKIYDNGRFTASRVDCDEKPKEGVNIFASLWLHDEVKVNNTYKSEVMINYCLGDTRHPCKYSKKLIDQMLDSYSCKIVFFGFLRSGEVITEPFLIKKEVFKNAKIIN
ncbi:hypothetical protein F889_02635 [Acinetobacter colistiniresistens]|uniref:Lipoprotein n=1 Tax=Acinetobacter colistiniresistens TaxID=280145 RepID=N9QVB1_9GAMM|nr:hypothetical protein [Acinetobacter colistiniresistens]ENX33971.1 hypothetical protein F889_02635 [Acinetobacter colistiniresistens]